MYQTRACVTQLLPWDGSSSELLFPEFLWSSAFENWMNCLLDWDEFVSQTWPILLSFHSSQGIVDKISIASQDWGTAS